MILVSTNGLTISQHFCSGELINTAVFYKADQCNDCKVVEMTCCEKRAAERNLASCGNNKTKKCCDDKAIFIQVDDEVQTLFVDFQSFVPVFTAVTPIQNIQFQEILPYFTPKYVNYKPPLIVEDDIEVLVESFLC